VKSSSQAARRGKRTEPPANKSIWAITRGDRHKLRHVVVERFVEELVGRGLGLVGPAGLPRPIVDKLAGVAQKAMQAPESAAALVKQGYDPHFLGPDQFAGFIASEKARWSAVASAVGLLSKS